MKIVLSGGELGGQEIEWPKNQEAVVIQGLRYRLADDIAVFDGVE